MALTQANIKHFYIPKIEQGGFLLDLCQVDVDVYNGAINSVSTPETNLGNGDWRVYGTVGTGNNISWSSTQTTMVSTPITLRFTATINSGSLSFGEYHNGTERVLLDTPYEVVDGLNEINMFSRANHVKIATLYPAVDTTFDIVFSDNSVVIHDVVVIPNYAETMYTNADQDTKGQQITPFIFDATGRATAIDYKNKHWNGKSGADTQWMPSGDFTVITAIEVVDDGGSHYIGSSAFYIGYNDYNHRFRVAFSGTTLAPLVANIPEGDYDIAVTFKESTKEIILYRDGVSIGSKTITTVTYPLDNFYLGQSNNTYGLIGRQGRTIIEDRTYTPTEITDAYTEWLANQ